MPDATPQSANGPHPLKEGLFITFEGIDGCGKTTHIRYLTETLENLGYSVLCLREPGGTTIGEHLRELLLDKAQTRMEARTELLLFEAARAQIVSERIRPALAAGTLVICDRFADSTVAYQGYGRGLDLDFIRELNAFACDGLVPDLTLFLDLGDDAFHARLARRSEDEKDRLDLESRDFLERTRRGFIKLWQEEPDRIKRISTDREKAVTRAEIETLVRLKIEEERQP